MTKNEVLLAAANFADSVKKSSAWVPYEMEIPDDEYDEYETLYCGTYMSIQPSGKYYTCWTSNQSNRDEMIDQWFWEEVENILPTYVFYSGEGDPCDCYCLRVKENERQKNTVDA